MSSLLCILLSFTLHYNAGVTAVGSTGSYAPFWLQTNRDGAIAPTGNSGVLQLGLAHPAEHPERWWDYDFALSLSGRLQERRSGNPQLDQLGTAWTNLAYAHLRLLCFDFTAGVQPYSFGPPDDSLSMGGLLFCRNAHPMPRITIGIDHYYAIPGTKGFLELRGGMSHLWQHDKVYVRHGFIHHKFLGVRLGGRWPVNLSYEFHHAAQWGGRSPVYGNLGSNWKGFANAFLARSGGSMDNDQLNAQGNHLCSQLLQLDAKGEQWKVSAYWQNLQEDGPVRAFWRTMNVRDGLWGIHAEQHAWPYISGFTYEFLNTTDQSGPLHDKDGYIYGGRDSYYQNAVYQNGWNYFRRGIGNAMLTSPVYNTDGNTQTENSRVCAHFIGVKGDIKGYRYRAVCSYAQNYGNDYQTRKTTSTNLGWMVEVSHQEPKAWDLEFTAALAGDAGTQFGNTVGIEVGVKKTF